jgi:transposase
LLGLPGLQVVEVDVEADGGLTVYVVTSDGGTTCPECGSRPGSVKECVASITRDVTFGDRSLAVVWAKRRWSCPALACTRRTFTEHLPAVAHRARITTRLRQSLAAAVAEQGRDVTEVAATHGVSWHTAHTAFAGQVDPVLDEAPQPVRVLGIDEIRRGKPRWRTDPDTGITTQLADRWHTGFTDLTGQQGILGHTEGRAKADVIAWLSRQSADWLAGIQLVATDLCAAFRAAVRIVLPHAALCADPFHVVQAANRMLTKVRQRLVREHYGRRVRKTDPEYGIKRGLRS